MLEALAVALLADTLRLTKVAELPQVNRVPVTRIEPGFMRALNGNAFAVLEEGSVLTVLRREKADAVEVSGSIQSSMSRIGPDLWAARFVIPHLESSFFTFGFRIVNAGKQRFADTLLLKGENAPSQPVASDSLKGTLHERVLKLDSPSEDRKVTIYLPPGKARPGLPVIYMVDGQMLKVFASVLEPLVGTGKVKPVALVGIDCADNMKRAEEYMSGLNAAAFDRHLRFVCKTVIPTVEQEFKLSTLPRDRTVLGFSHGGTFAATAALVHPDIFGNAIALAPTVDQINPTYTNIALSKKSRSQFWVSVGKLDGFWIKSQALVPQLKELGAKVQYTEAYAAHDFAFCRFAFVKALTGR